MKTILCLLAICLFFSCKNNAEEEEQLRVCVKDFGDAYFNLNLHKALKLCTQESGSWIGYLATNLTQADLNVLNAVEEASVSEVENVIMTCDSLATATIMVNHYLNLGDIGQTATLAHDGRFRINLVKREGRWKVKMEGLPQNERRNHD